MKKIKKQFKSVALILSMLVFFQGCSVYKSLPITLEQAANEELKVKVINKSNEKFKFNRIEVEDGNYFGVKKSKNVTVKTPLDQELINTIHEKDKSLSTILSIGIPVIIVGSFIGIAAALYSWGGGFGSAGF